MRKILVLLLILPSTCWAVSAITYLMFTTDDNGLNTASTTTYMLVYGNKTSSTTEADVNEGLPPGTVSHLRCKVSSSPAVANALTITFRVAAADTSLTCTITNPALTCSDQANTATISTDPRTSYKVVFATAGEAITLTCRAYYQRT